MALEDRKREGGNHTRYVDRWYNPSKTRIN